MSEPVKITQEELDDLRRRAAVAEFVQPPAANPLIAEVGREIAEGVKYALTGWGPKIHTPFDIVCPSGQKCQARQITIEDAISLGMLDSLDMFTNNLMKPIIEGAEEVPETEANKSILDGLKDPERRANFFGTVNRVVAHAVLQPEIVLEDNGDLESHQVFANDIPFQDKMHIFRRVFAGGSTLDRFQQGSEAVLADVAPVAGVQVPSE